mmetsp:Transcript_69082/g.202256  ORF Transcript_69082/g.202256 Transcript_69082/m.202256 type:complete len:347 (+) Transcript_69082:295-1335(+)
MDAQQLVSLLVSQDLHEANVLLIGLRTGVCTKDKLPLLVLNALLLEILLCLANPCHLWVGVNDGRHAVVVEVRLLARGEELGDERPLILGLVRQHRPLDNVANGVDARQVRLEMVVDLDLLAIHLDAECLQAKVVHVLAPPHADQNDVRVQRRRLAPGRRLEVDLARAVDLLNTRDLGLQLELHALLLEETVEILGHLCVDAHPADGVQELHDRDLAAQPGPDGAQLQADDAAADDRELLGDLLQSQSACARDDLLLVEIDAGQADDVGPCGQHDVLALDDLLSASIESHLHGVGACERAMANHIVDLIHFEEHLDALRQHAHGLLLVLHHRWQVQFNATVDLDPA